MLTHATADGASPYAVRASHLAPVTPSTRSTSPSSAPVTAIGYFVIVKAVRASARLTSTERLVLLTIASHADNRTGEAWPSMPTLAAECGLTTRTIERTVAGMVAAGWLTRDTAASRWGTNVYQVTPVLGDVRAASPRRLTGRHPDRGTPDTRSGNLSIPLSIDPHVCAPLGISSPTNAHTRDFDEVSKSPREETGVKLGETAEHQVGLAAAPVVTSTVPESATVNPNNRTTNETGTAEHQVDLAAEIVIALAEHPELARVARLPFAALLAAEGRPLSVVRRALGQLAEHTRAAAAAGEPFSASTLARKTRVYVQRAYADPSPKAASPAPVVTPEPPPPPPRLGEAAAAFRTLVSGIGVGTVRPCRSPSTRAASPAPGHLAAAAVPLRGVLAALDPSEGGQTMIHPRRR